MKLKSYVFAALALSIMSGCSEDEIINNGTDGNVVSSDDKAYVSVKITLPTSSSVTRAEQPEYDNGTKDEWAVKDVTLLFFAQGDATTEEGYVLRNVASTLEGINTVENGLTFSNDFFGDKNANTNGDPITITTAQTDVIGVAEDVTRVVALINISSEAGIAKTDLRVGKTFGDINKVLSLAVGDVTGDTNGFLMTSNPQLNSVSPATAFNLTTCTPQATEELAKKNMTTVSVERIVSKVELLESETTSPDVVSSIDNLQKLSGSGWYKLKNGNSFQMAYKVEEGLHHAGDIIVIEGWTLDVTNKKSFPFRKVDVATWSQGNSTVWDLISANNRMFFAVDPNYDGNGYTTKSDFNTITTNTSFSENLSPASIANTPIPTDMKRYPQYCLENTFNIDNQKKDQTTRLVIKAKYYPNTTNSSEADGTWYALNKKTAHYSLADLTTEIIKIANTESIFYEKTADITLSSGANCNVEKVVINGNTHESNSAVVEQLNARLEIVRYQEGICYYPIRIRHFSDAEVYTSGDAFAFVNGKYTDKELGRYGVVRNNSYRVQIKKISKPGDPEIPPTPDEPDDDENLYITCDIQILAWALRQVQDAEL